MANKKQLRVFLANLNIEVPVYKHLKATSQVEVLVSDIPKDIARNAGLSKQRTAVYWYGENSGGNRLIEEGAETEEQKKAREVIETIASNIENLANGVRKILEGRLTKQAIVLLIASAAGMSRDKETVTRIIEEIAKLDSTFLKKK